MTVQPVPGPPGYSVEIGPAEIEAPAPGPAPLPPMTAPPRRLGDPVSFAFGRTYRASVELSGLQAAFATKAAIAQRFVDLGFRGVQVAESAAELDPSWPAEAKAGATPNTRWAIGVYTGAPTTAPMPDGVTAAWEG